MLYVQLDATWPDNPKIIDAGLDGAGLHAVVMCIAKRQNTDGWVHRRVLYRQGASDELIDRLVDLTLFDSEGDRVRAHDWHDRNPSQAAIEAKRLAKIQAGKKGNHERWGHPGAFDHCPICQPNGQVVAGCDPVGSLGDPKSSPESKTTGAIASAIDRVNPEAYRLSDEQLTEGLRGIDLVRQQNGIARKTGAA